jgi:hypothetical protein
VLNHARAAGKEIHRETITSKSIFLESRIRVCHLLSRGLQLSGTSTFKTVFFIAERILILDCCQNKEEMRSNVAK